MHFPPPEPTFIIRLDQNWGTFCTVIGEQKRFEKSWWCFFGLIRIQNCFEIHTYYILSYYTNVNENNLRQWKWRNITRKTTTKNHNHSILICPGGCCFPEIFHFLYFPPAAKNWFIDIFPRKRGRCPKNKQSIRLLGTTPFLPAAFPLLPGNCSDFRGDWGIKDLTEIGEKSGRKRKKLRRLGYKISLPLVESKPDEYHWQSN